MLPTTQDVQPLALDQRVILLAPSLGWWKGMYRIRDAKVSLRGATINSPTTQPQVKLLDCCEGAKVWKARFQKIDSAREALTEKYSLNFPIHGIRIVPVTKAGEFFNRLVRNQDSIARQLADAADAFTAEFANLLQMVRQHIAGDVWDDIQSRLPSQNTIRGYFYVDCPAVSLVHNNTAETLSGDLADHADFIRETTRRQVDVAISSMVAGPRQALAEALEELQGLIERDGRVTSKSFNPVRAAIDKIHMFDFVANDQLLQQIRTLETRLGQTDTRGVDSSTATTSGLIQLLQDVRTSAVNEVQQKTDAAKFSRPLRRLDVA